MGIDMSSLTSEWIIEYWITHIGDWIDFRQVEEDRARETVGRFSNWHLLDVPLTDILNSSGTPLEHDWFFNGRVNEYAKHFGTENIPAVILIPIIREDVNSLLHWKIDEGVVKWEPADGRHRVLQAVRAGLKTIKAYVPDEVYKNDNSYKR